MASVGTVPSHTLSSPPPRVLRWPIVSNTRGVRLLARASASLHVALQGQYSVERLVELHAFASARGSVAARLRCSLLLLATPLPSFLMNTLIDVAFPLAPPQDGTYANYTFWLRLWVVGVCIAHVSYDQYRHYLPELQLKLTACRILGFSLCASSGAVLYLVGMSSIVGFPVPFALVFSAPAFGVLFWGALGLLFWTELVHNRELRLDLLRVTGLLAVQLSLTLVYPAFNHVFSKAHGLEQTVLSLLLPVIKLLAKRALCAAMQSQDDDHLPETVVFNAEVFHSLFVSCCMQSSTSVTTTAILMAMDVLDTLLSLRFVDPLVRQLRQLEQSHKRASTAVPEPPRFVETAIHLVIHGTLSCQQAATLAPASTVKIRLMSRHTTATRKLNTIVPTARLSDAVPVLSSTSPAAHAIESTSVLHAMAGDSEIMAHTLPSLRERQCYVATTLRLLHVADFVLLTAFAEVVVALIYAGYLVTAYHLPNRKYYQQLDTQTSAELWHNVTTVLVHVALEFASFACVCVVLQRKLGVSPLHQIAFVLRHQWQLVQSKLVLWVLFTMQSNVEHSGYDYSFQFAWLQRTS